MKSLLHKILIFGILTPVVTLLVLEGTLRLVWTNPYRLVNETSWTDGNGDTELLRLHTAGLDIEADADGLYGGAHRVRARITDRRSISSGNGSRDHAAERLAMGGSTTECGLLPEGQRWPDLLAQPTRNYGVSGNASIDTLRNLRFLLSQEGPGLERIYVLHAYNDLLILLRHGPNFQFERRDGGAMDLLAAERPGQAAGIELSSSWLISFLTEQSGRLFGRRYLKTYRSQVEAQRELPPLDEAGYAELLELIPGGLLEKSGMIYRQIVSLARVYGTEVVFLTQPHAYRSDFDPPGDDLRTYPVWRGRKLSAEQAARLLDAINENTRGLAESLDVRLIDVAARFAELDPDPLFYDQVHCTPEGAERFAELVNQANAAGDEVAEVKR